MSDHFPGDAKSNICILLVETLTRTAGNAVFGKYYRPLFLGEVFGDSVSRWFWRIISFLEETSVPPMDPYVVVILKTPPFLFFFFFFVLPMLVWFTSCTRWVIAGVSS